MSAAPPQMRRIPDEQFFDLRSWSADKAEDYDSAILKTLNSGIVRASLSNKKIITVRVGTKFFKINEKIIE